jgi:hypothetical protein
MKGDTGVLALLLHCFNACVVEGSTPAPEIDEATMAAAIKLSKYHIGQVKLIHSEGDVANGDLAALHAKIIQLSERKGWLKAADVRDIDRQTKKQFSADDIRRHFQELACSGFGQTRGQRTKLMWSIHKDIPPDGNPPHSNKTQDSFDKLRTVSGQTEGKPESTTDISVQPFILEILEKTQDNSGQTQDSQSASESITNSSVQELVSQTQDTKDTFEPANTQMDESVGQKPIKSDADSFSVLSCPELVSESCDSATVGIPAQNKTQDTCPETVLSCPELSSDVTQVKSPMPLEQTTSTSTDNSGAAEVEMPAVATAPRTPVENEPEATEPTPNVETPQHPRQDAVEEKKALSGIELRCRGQLEAALWAGSIQEQMSALARIRAEYGPTTYQNAIDALTPDEQQQIEELRHRRNR